MLWLLGLAIGSFLLGCTQRDKFPGKGKGVVDFVIDDPELETVFLEALQEWTDAGVVAAAIATVNINPKGMPVSWSAPEDINHHCDIPDGTIPEGRYVGGCTLHEYGEFRRPLWITKLPGDSRERIKLNAMHEIIHMIVPTQDHLPDDQEGIMNLKANSTVITDADMAFLAERTDVA